MNLTELPRLTFSQIKEGLRVIFIDPEFNVYGHLGTVRKKDLLFNEFYITWDVARFNSTNRGLRPWRASGHFAIPTPFALEYVRREQYANQYL